jgi:uncharacterized protein YcfL
MKKYLFLLLISLLVVSCSKVKVEGNVKGGSPLERIEFIEASGVATLPLVNIGVDEKVISKVNSRLLRMVCTQ